MSNQLVPGRSRDTVGQDLMAVINSMASPGKVRILLVWSVYFCYTNQVLTLVSKPVIVTHMITSVEECA